MVSGVEATRVFQRPVYQALEPFLSKPNVTSIGQAKSIIHQKYPNLPPSIRNIPRGTLDRIAADLFQRGVFQSKEAAKTYFSRPHTAIPIASNNSVDAVSLESPTSKPICEAEDVDATAPSEDMSSQVLDPQASGCSSGAPPASKIRDDSVAPASSEKTSTIPFTVQHYVLVEVQRVLEKECFRFAQQKHPELLEAQLWDCCEAVKLDQIMKKLGVSSMRVGMGESEQPDSAAMTELAKSICRLRHTAVHRLRLYDREFLHLLWDSQELLALLGDKDALGFVRELRWWIRTTVRARRGDVTERMQGLDFWDKQIRVDAEEMRKALRDWADVDVPQHLRGPQKISTGPDRKYEDNGHGGSRTLESVSGMVSWLSMQSCRRILVGCLLVVWSFLSGVGWEDTLLVSMSSGAGANQEDENGLYGGSRTPESPWRFVSGLSLQSSRKMLAAYLLVIWSCLTGVGWENALPLLLGSMEKSG